MRQTRRDFLKTAGAVVAGLHWFGLPAAEGSGRVLAEVRNRYEGELLKGIVPFWERFSIDRENGGYFNCLERDGKVFDAVKNCWMQWREAYMFARLYNSEYREERFLKQALWGAEFMMGKTRISPGVYPREVRRDGAVSGLAPAGQADFTACFGAMACAELFKATGRESYRQEALDCLRTFDESCRHALVADPRLPGAVAWHRLAFPMFRLNVLLVLNRCTGGWEREMDDAVTGIRQFAHPELGLLFEVRHPDKGFDLESQDGRFVNCGHALEGLSFAQHRIRQTRCQGDLEFAAHTVDAMAKFSVDPTDGGLKYYRDALGKPVSRHEAPMKVWWGQNEAASAFLQAFELTGEGKFLDYFKRIDTFSWRHLKDPDYPEWFAYAEVNGCRLHTYKGNREKTLFHLPRYLLNCIEICKRLA